MNEKQLVPEELRTLLERFKVMVLGRAQGERQDEEEYYRIRKALVGQKALESCLPDFVRACKSITDFWAFISSESSTYAGRRQYLRDQFEPVEWVVAHLCSGSGLDVELGAAPSPSDALSQPFITEQLAKAEEKLRSGDFSGSITNSRALAEQVLLALQKRLPGCSEVNDGDIGKMYRAVQKALHLDPGQKELDTQLRQILSGLASIVTGLGAVRNAAGDAHARTYNPAKHHARLALNAAKTLTGFLVETYEYQVAKGLISDPGVQV